MAQELLKKMPAEKRWTITAKALTGLYVMIALKANELVLGKGEGVIAPISGWEMRKDISVKVLTLAAKRFYPWVKETFKIPVEDAIGGLKLVWVAAILLGGPEFESKTVEENREKAVVRITKCPWWERYKENEVKPEFTVCSAVDQVMVDEGLKAINPKITFKLVKAKPWGDTYCEFVYEYKEE